MVLVPHHTHNLDRHFWSLSTLRISNHIYKNIFSSIHPAFYLLHKCLRHQSVYSLIHKYLLKLIATALTVRTFLIAET